MTLLLALLASVASATCPASVEDLLGEIQAAESAIAAKASDAFQVARDGASESLTCLSRPITPVGAAAYHRLMAYDAFIYQKPDDVLTNFQASIVIQPDYAIPDGVAPPDSPLAGMYLQAAFEDPGETVPVKPPPFMWVNVDGKRNGDRPTELPSVLQLLTPQGDLQETMYLRPGDAPPDWVDSAELAPPPPDPVPVAPLPEPGRSRGVSVPLLAVAGGAVVTSGVLFGMSSSAKAQFLDPAVSMDEVEGLANRANGLGYASQAALGTGVVFGILGVSGAF